MATITSTRTFYVMDCPTNSCGIMFAIDDAYDDRRRRDLRSFYCPNGHSLSYSGESDTAKIKRLTSRERHLTDQLEATNRSNSALKGVVTRKTNQLDRVENGVCPHCKRSFANLRRHIDNKHNADLPH